MWFDYDDSYQKYDSTVIRLRFDSSEKVAKWASWQYVNESMNDTLKAFRVNVSIQTLEYSPASVATR